MGAAKMPSQQELDNRARAIADLTRVLDEHLKQIGVHPWSKLAAPTIAQIDDATWKQLAELTGRANYTPSQLTRGQLLASYRARVSHLAAVRTQEGV